MTTTTKFVTISTDNDAWGDVTAMADFNVAAEVQQIAEAAKANGIEVLIDTTPSTLYDVDGNERDQIDWFSEWCTEGWKWSDSQWRQWFAGCI